MIIVDVPNSTDMTNDNLVQIQQRQKNAERKRQYIKAQTQKLLDVRRQLTDEQPHVQLTAAVTNNKYIARKDLTDFDEKKVPCHNVGGMNYKCDDCGACMFKGEKSMGSFRGDTPKAKFSLCCSKGQIKLPPSERASRKPQEPLNRLYQEG